MAIVARGLGLPEDGALVVGGLGTVEVDANAMYAALSATGTLTATLTAAETGPVSPPAGGGNTAPWLSFKDRQTPIPGPMRAFLAGRGTLTADLDFIVDFDAELELLLLAGVL